MRFSLLCNSPFGMCIRCVLSKNGVRCGNLLCLHFITQFNVSIKIGKKCSGRWDYEKKLSLFLSYIHLLCVRVYVWIEPWAILLHLLCCNIYSAQKWTRMSKEAIKEPPIFFSHFTGYELWCTTFAIGITLFHHNAWNSWFNRDLHINCVVFACEFLFFGSSSFVQQ